MYTVLKLLWPFEGNREAEVVSGGNEFDTLLYCVLTAPKSSLCPSPFTPPYHPPLPPPPASP